MRRCLSVAKTPARIRLSEWAAEHARLKDGSKYRPWPFQVEILDTMVAPRTSMFTWMKSARVGYTQCLLAYIGHRIANDPGNGLMVRPDDKVVAEFFKEHINNVLTWPEVKKALAAGALLGTTRDTIVAKYFPGGHLKGIGAQSPTGFRDHDADFVIFDEADGYPVVAGLDGDQFTLGHKRLEQSHDPRDLAGSTPTEESVSKIFRRFNDSDRRFYEVPCSVCHKPQRLVWGQGREDEPGLRWHPFEAPREVWYQCVNGCKMPESKKLWALQNGLWVPEAPEVYEQTGHAGFHINSLYSLQPNAEWKHLIEEFLKSYKSPSTLKTFINTTLGEVWRVKGEAPEWKRLYDRREQREQGKVPYGACFLTCAIDVQAASGGRLEIKVEGHGRGGSTFPVDFEVIHGSPWEQATWDKAEAYCRGKWQHENGEMLGIFKGAVDVGYATLPAYRFCKKMGLNWFMPVRGSPNLTAPAIAASTAMELTGKTGKKLKDVVRVHLVGGHILKQELYGNLNLEKPEDGKPYPPGYVHIPSWFSEEMCKQLVAEEWVADKNDWIKRHPANEQLDLWVYNRAAAIAAGCDKWTDAEWATLEAQFAHPEHEVQRPPEQPKAVRQERVEEPEQPVREPEPKPRQRPQRRSSWLRR